MLNGVLGDGPITGLDDPNRATMLLQFAGEFADADTKRRIWESADASVEPTWDREAGEFTLGFGLDEPHPRGQLNARAMAGWVGTPGAWSRIFNEPNLDKFNEPTVEGVDFPSFALSQASWDGVALHLAVHPQNAGNEGRKTSLRITNAVSTNGWVVTYAGGESVAFSAGESGEANDVEIELIADNRTALVRRA